MIKLLKWLLKVVIGVIVLTLVYIGINEGMAAYIHYNIEQSYFNTSTSYVYVETRENEKIIVDTVESVLNKYPDDLVKEFESSWIIVVSTRPPAHLAQAATIALDKVSGLNLGTAKAIWISSYMLEQSEEIFAHEFGHFVAYELGAIDYSDEFVELYKGHKNDFIQCETSKVNEHNTSNSNEFFAMLCEQYVRDPEHLKDNHNECYDFIDKTLSQEAHPFFWSKYANEFKSTMSIAISQIKKRV